MLASTFTSLVLSIVSINRCTFVLSGSPDPNSRMYSWGLFTTPVYDEKKHIQGCVAYSSSTKLGPSLKTAQAFGILLVIFSVVCFLGLILVQLFLERGTKTIYHVIRVLLPSAFCCQLLTFAVFASDFCKEIQGGDDDTHQLQPATCMPGEAGVVAIFNLVAIIVMTIVMSMISPPDHPVLQLYGTGNNVILKDDWSNGNGYSYNSSEQKAARKKKRKKKKEHKMEKVSMMEPSCPGQDQVKTTIINGPTSKQIIKEITHPDGSQTITTVVEEIQPYEQELDNDEESTVIEIV